MVSSFWITGSTGSGKTARLVRQFIEWSLDHQASSQSDRSESSPGTLLIFAANSVNRMALADRLATATQGQVPVYSVTPLGFVQSEVQLFWPLLRQQLGLTAQFPLRLRPEKEQELATQLWQPELEAGQLQMDGISPFFQVRRTLDMMSLAAFAGIPAEDISSLLAAGWVQSGSPELWQTVEMVLLRWREWCLTRGLLTYGIMSELYWRYLLPHQTYQYHLNRRYRGVLADDVDEYPAIARSWFECFLDQGALAAFTFNPEGQVRLGQGADPAHLQGLAAHCHPESLTVPVGATLGSLWGSAIADWVQDPFALPELPPAIRAIQTPSRAQLLRQTAETIATAVESGEIQPQEVAVIAPGLDAIARYSLTEILLKRQISVSALSEQRPLASSPIVRSLLTLLALVYPGLGRLLDRDAIAELLVVFSQTAATTAGQSWIDLARIDPVRAELLADYCFEPHPEQPRLLPVTTFPRWDRLGYQATQAYHEILNWVTDQGQQQQQRLLPNAVVLLDRAIQRFLWRGSNLPTDQLAVLRELMETAQHYWEVEGRLQERDRTHVISTPETVAQFIHLLQSGVVTANPYPVAPLTAASRRAVTLSTVFQYRAHRLTHRWQFWLDASSPRWLTGDDSRFAAPLFLRDRLLQPWTSEDALSAAEARLRRTLLDLLGRTTERIYLCHSELATNGQDQSGPMLSLVNVATTDADPLAFTLP